MPFTQLNSENNFNCAEYFNSPFYQTGFYDETNYLPLILPHEEISLIENDNFLVIGYAGVDGIVFGYRKNYLGIWAFYPILKEYKLMGKTLDEFIQDWLENKLTL